MQLRPGVQRYVAPLGERFVALYLFVGPEGALLFDTGITESVTGTLLPALEAEGFDLARLRWAVTSHCDFDHTGGTAALKAAAPHVELMCGRADREMTEDLEALIAGRYGEFRSPDGFDDPPETTAYIRANSELAPVDRVLDGGEEFDLGDRVIRVLHVPGHSPGHLAIWDPASRVLAIGDATLGTTVPYADGSPAFPPTYRDTDPYLASIELFRSFDAEVLGTAHYPLYEGEAVSAFLDESAEYTRVLDAAIEGALRAAGAPLTSLELIHRIAAEVGPWSPSAAEYLIFPVTGNLERLRDRGVLVETPGGAGVHRTWAVAA